MCHLHSQFPQRQNKSIVNKQLSSGSIFSNVSHHKTVLLAHEIKCWNRFADLCAQIISSFSSHWTILTITRTWQNLLIYQKRTLGKCKSTVTEYCNISCVKRGYLRLLSVHTSPTQTTVNFGFSPWTVTPSLQIQLLDSSPTLDRLNESEYSWRSLKDCDVILK